MSDVTIALRYLFAVSVLHSMARGLQDLGQAQNGKSESSLFNSSQFNHEIGTFQHYGSWSEWSPCSKTCGSGVALRQRQCHTRYGNPRWRDESSCSDAIEYKLCKLSDCLSGTPDYRTRQCSQYNNRLVAGQHAKSWTPTSGGSNPCELRCEAQDTKMVYGFGKVEDGTPCQKDGVCVDGRCLVTGCDQKLGSGAVIDECGICRGRNTTCVHYKDALYGQQDNLPLSDRSHYQEVVVLPIGTMNFKLHQLMGKNVLAMRDRTVAILFHGYQSAEKQISGTVVKYFKDDANQSEVLRLKGPTTTEIYVLVLLRGKNPGIHYEYWLPQDPTRLPHNRPVIPNLHANVSPKASFHPTPMKHHKTLKPYVTSQSHGLLTVNPLYRSHIHNSDSNQVMYGPKRKGFMSPKGSFQNIVTEKQIYPVTTTTTTPLPTFLPVKHAIYKQIYKTPKPVFNYYEKYRNISYITPLDVYRHIETISKKNSSKADDVETENDVLPETKEDRKVKSISLNGNGEKDEQKDGAFIGDVYQQPVKEKLSSRWEYNFNENGEDTVRRRFVPTPISVAVLPLPETRNYTKTRRGRRRGRNHHTQRSTNGELCETCQRVRDQTRHFCTSDFVIRAFILGYEFLHGETRYELEVLQSFKNNWGLLPREFVWSPDTCQCPRLRSGKEYLIMGKSDNNYRKNESRLMVDKNCFVRVFNPKFTKRLNKLKRDQARKCSKIS